MDNIMSKFFFRGKPDIMGKNNMGTYKPKPTVKLGTESNPLTLNVQSDERKEEVEVTVNEHNFFANITVNADIEENIKENQRLASIAEQTADAIIMHDKNLKISFWNHSAETLSLIHI